MSDSFSTEKISSTSTLVSKLDLCAEHLTSNKIVIFASP